MHLVSSDGVTGAVQQSLFMPMLTRMPKARVKGLVIALSPNAVPGAVLRQNGVPVYDVPLSRQRFSTGAFSQLLKTTRAFRPDVIQAWGYTAQILSAWLKGRCEWEARVLWSPANTTPLARGAGFIDQQKLKFAAKLASRADRIVYTSEAAASAHRRVGLPEDAYAVVPPGVDPTRFKPDFTTRHKVREQLGLGDDAFVIGMLAPFQPDYDHSTLIKGIGEMIKTNPNIALLLAGHGVQKGNGPLMALVGGGTLGTRTQLLGEWSDVSSFYNACDVACSTALTDGARMSLVMAMLCGVPCVATGMGAQGEVIGQFGVAIEPGSPTAVIRGITRVMQMPPDKRVFMAQGARKHALTNFVAIRSLQKYQQLYFEMAGRVLPAASAAPVPEVDATIPVPTPQEQAARKPAPKPKANRTVDMYELSDPDSLEARDKPEPEPAAARAGEGDVLSLFESSMAEQKSTSGSPMSERARGVAEIEEDLLAPELLEADAKTTTAAAAPEVTKVATKNAPSTPTTTPAPTKEPTKKPAPTTDTKPKAEAPAPTPAAAPAAATTTASTEFELSLLDTMSFMTPLTSAQPVSSVKVEVSITGLSLSAAEGAKGESKAVEAAPATDASTPAPQADSTTVPAIAVDALLSLVDEPKAPSATQSTPTSESTASDEKQQLSVG